MADNTYIAHIRAANLSNQLLMAYAYECSGASREWERHALTLALKEFDSLSLALEAIRARLAAICQAEGGE